VFLDDLLYARLAAAAYNPAAAPGVQRITFQDISADITGNICAVRGTNSFATLKRDMTVVGMVPVDHPLLGPCNAGALVAALGLLPLIPASVDTFIGHSEAGGIAPLLAALRGAKLLVRWDGVEVGGPLLVAALAGVVCRSYHFRGSPVTWWPFGMYAQISPLIDIGDWTPFPILAHSIERAVVWVAAHVAEQIKVDA
jgi:hypothetical protein